MGTRLEEAVRDGIIVLEKGEPSNSAPKKYGNGHHKRKESDVGMVSGNPSAAATQLPLPYHYMQYSQHPFFPPFYQQYPLPPGQPPVPVNAIAQQVQQQPPAQQQQQQQQGPRPKPSFPPIPMRYGELLPTLLAKGHCVTRPGKPPPNPLPPRFRQDLTCEFHQGAQGHDIEGCYALKYIVKDLIEKGRLTFENSVPHVLDNPLPNHAAVNMIEAFEGIPVPQDDPMLDVRNVVTPLVPLHVKLCQASLFNHDHASCSECLQNPMGCRVVQDDIQSLMDDKHLIASDVCVIVPGLTIEGAESRRAGTDMASLKDAQKAVQEGQAAGWGRVIQIVENKREEGLGFSPTSGVSTGTFYSAGFINAIAEDAAGSSHVPTFVVPGGAMRNWEAIDVPLIMHASM